MADKEYTLFELHFDGGLQFGPERLFGGDADKETETEGEDGLLPFGGDADEESDAETDGDEAETETADADAEDGTEDDGGSAVGMVVGLVALAVAAAVARRLLGGEDEVEIEPAEADPETDDVEEFEPESAE